MRAFFVLWTVLARLSPAFLVPCLLCPRVFVSSRLGGAAAWSAHLQLITWLLHLGLKSRSPRCVLCQFLVNLERYQLGSVRFSFVCLPPWPLLICVLLSVHLPTPPAPVSLQLPVFRLVPFSARSLTGSVFCRSVNEPLNPALTWLSCLFLGFSLWVEFKSNSLRVKTWF